MEFSCFYTEPQPLHSIQERMISCSISVLDGQNVSPNFKPRYALPKHKDFEDAPKKRVASIYSLTPVPTCH